MTQPKDPQEINCRICVESKEENNCSHRLPLQMGYGFGRVSGWSGIGLTYRCPDCAETLWFAEDFECSSGEIERNKAKKERNKKWGEAVALGEFE